MRTPSTSKTTKPERPRIASLKPAAVARIGHNNPPEPIENAKPAPAPKPVPPLLVPRATACKMLSISVATAIRLEAAGRLTAIKLFPSSNSKTHYRVAQVRALANGAEAADA